MSLFGRRGGIFNSRPSVLEVVDMLVTDVEVEGKKQGYSRASREYENVFLSIAKDFEDTKRIIEEQKNSYNNKADILIERLEALENERKTLEKCVNTKAKDVSCKYHLPIDKVQNALNTGNLLTGGTLEMADFLTIIYVYKEKKLREAEQKGYIEAKKLYQDKIQKLKNELKQLSKNGAVEIQNLIAMISEVLDAIANEQMKIAELNVLL